MTTFGNIHRMVSVTALLALMLLASCSKVKFAGEIDSVNGNMNKSSLLRFDIDWSHIGEDKPVEMTVLMNRIQNVTLHYAWRVDSDGNIIAPIAPDNTQLPSHVVQNGLYTVMAVTACDKEDFSIPDIEAYHDSLEFSSKDVYVEIPEVPYDLRFQQNLIDLNPMCPFIKTVKPLYYVRSGNNALVSSVNESETDGHVSIPVAPERLTHNISFKVFLRTEQSRADGPASEVKDSLLDVVYLDTLKAAISGIPSSVQLMSGQMTNLKTGKMGFRMKKQEDTRVTDASSTPNLYEGNYEGSVNAFGLFPSTDGELLAGPGILNIFLYPKVYYENRAGEIVALTRVFHASLNIKKEIEDAKIMLKSSNKEYYVYGKETDTELEIRTSIELSYQDVLSGTSQGLKEWMKNQIVPDHFNPGLEM